MSINKITIKGGFGKDGSPEKVPVFDLVMGDIVSIVGPTGCGKTTLINDIELFANRNTPSGRQILINDEPIPEDFSFDPAKHPIALISQHTNFLSDLPVGEFLTIHATVRGAQNIDKVIDETIEFANQLTGEAIVKETTMTELSGGQTRSLLIADAVIIGNSPIILLDEIENAGIHKTKALELLKAYRKIFVFVTHDPTIALLSDFRIVMKNGAMQKIIVSSTEETKVGNKLKLIDDVILHYRSLIRKGEELDVEHLNKILV
ncbi:MAG: ATP-binding cassette domain-containing protein [Bacteroidota bacterium]|nr:ATP-binding cassette domain-containing protein [Bacteroidota bacterium]MDP4225122.1 ATP-binding cassette domain-containing protein [Bacteroidota bacterium]MDP4273164.1 ATP-binding cassette domain-containing protein [Bacteroidota bacterium]